MGEPAERYALPAYKWISEKKTVQNANLHGLTIFHGGIGFRIRNYSHEKRLIVVQNIYREDGTCERYVLQGYFVENWEHDIEKWQTHQLVLFPFESPHGMVNIITFSYVIHKDGEPLTSECEYKFARREDFFNGYIGHDDFHEQYFKKESTYHITDHGHHDIQEASYTVMRNPHEAQAQPFFTRGDPGGPAHPVHEIHRRLDMVAEAKHREPHRRHYVHLAMFNFENEHIINHLLHLHYLGIEVECLGGWEQTSSADWSDDVARLRKAGIGVYGIVRNTPYTPDEGIASMHTKIIDFDGMMVMSSSYNLDFHRWGGNWENGLFINSLPITFLYQHIYQTIKGGVFKGHQIQMERPYNLYYSFGKYYDEQRRSVSAADALLREISCARSSLFVAMFDLGDVYLKGPYFQGASLLDMLLEAKRRGVYIVIVLNGFRAERDDLPIESDLSRLRPLRPAVQHLIDSGIEVLLLYHHDTPYSPLHHKFAIFDEETVIAESYNWYSASLYSDEVFSVIRDKSLARAYIEEIFLMMKKFRIRRGQSVYV
ncbi:MAG: phospholipase D-like domain-containing protein [Vulcanimicrobiota bacterium]